MAILSEYYRPKSLDEALQLLHRTDVKLAPLAGGYRLVGELETRRRPDVDGVVDLRDLGLGTVEERDSVLHVGATATLTDVMEHPRAGDLAGGLLRRTGRYEGPVNFRDQATVGGVVASQRTDSEFYAALLGLDASVVIMDHEGETSIPLSDLPVSLGSQTENRQRLVIQIRVPMLQLAGGHARVARTPADRCIVAAVAVVGNDVERIALCGIGPRPLLKGETPDPPTDFKGSAEYRLWAGEVVKRRALEEARGG